MYQLIYINTLIFCSLWVSSTPTISTWVEACPSFNFQWGAVRDIPGIADIDSYLMIRAVDITTGDILCTVPAFHNLDKIPCPGMDLDQYRLELIFLDAPHLLCIIYADSEPVEYSSCPDPPAGARVELRGRYPIPEPAASTEIIIPPSPDLSVSLDTSEDLELLSYWLRWYDLGDPISWQNRWNAEILGAATRTNTPPMLLKRVMMQESQLWVIWNNPAGEIGMMQLTWDGADTALRYSQDLYQILCPRAIYPYYCQLPYDLLSSTQKDRIKSALVSELILDGDPLTRAAQVSIDLSYYGYILAAYYSYSAALGYPSWDHALALYNAGAGCIATGMICQDGLDYIERITK